MNWSVLGWLQVIERSSPADLGWDAGNPAPEEALTAIAIARGLGGMEHVPFIRWTGPFPHPLGRRLVAAGVTGPADRAGIEMVKRAGAEAWRIHQERKGEG